MKKKHWPTEQQVVDACDAMGVDTGYGTDAIAKSEDLSAQLRAYLPPEFHEISAQKLAGHGVDCRKKGLLKKVGKGNGQRSEADLEMAGAGQLGETRREAASVYKWTDSDEYKKTVRKEVVERDAGRCQFCYETNRLNVHHRSYKRCRQPGEVDDCITLCRTCHGYLHDAWDKRKCGNPSPLQMELIALRGGE